jgi:hypothetical protein
MYVYVQPSTDAHHTVLAKEAFELFSRNVGVQQVLHYHGDNGRFAESLFMAHARNLGQRVTHCGVNAHFQNGIAERRIRDVQDRGRTMIVHAKHHWPDAIETCMWPYATRPTILRSTKFRKIWPIQSASRQPPILIPCTYTRRSANLIGPNSKRPCSKKSRHTKSTDIGN